MIVIVIDSLVIKLSLWSDMTLVYQASQRLFTNTGGQWLQTHIWRQSSQNLPLLHTKDQWTLGINSLEQGFPLPPKIDQIGLKIECSSATNHAPFVHMSKYKSQLSQQQTQQQLSSTIIIPAKMRTSATSFNVLNVNNNTLERQNSLLERDFSNTEDMSGGRRLDKPLEIIFPCLVTVWLIWQYQFWKGSQHLIQWQCTGK